MRKRATIVSVFILLITSVMLSAQYAPAVDSAGTDAVYCDSSAISTWATKCKIIRGYTRIDDKDSGRASTGTEENCLGKADNITASLGDGGIAVLSFKDPISDIEGHDFAVFENSFDGRFLELAFVEVSSDSIKWVRFPSVSETPVKYQTGAFENLDPEKIYNLAGKYKALYGTPFDLSDIKDSAGIDLQNIKYIRVIDVVGCISEPYATLDSKSNKINDPWPTPFPQSGFDLDAVAVLRSVASHIETLQNYSVTIYPNPAKETVQISFREDMERSMKIIDTTGRILLQKRISGKWSDFNVSDFQRGIYFIEISEKGKRTVFKIIKT
jgi:hypothetical protein